MSNQKQQCSFKVGDRVIYKPSERGWGQVIMSSPSGKLERGKEYTVTAIVKNAYIVVEGYSDPGGGIHWTEFKSAEAS